MVTTRRILAIAALQLGALVVVLGMDQFGSLDFEVYMLAAEAWRSGGDIYNLPPVQTALGPLELPFMYPPVAAALLSLLALLPRGLAIALWYALSLAFLGLALLAFAHVVAARFPGVDARLLAMVCLPFATLLGPVREDLTFGQINLVLMALVAADCLARRPRWPRGLLVGVAAGVKLLPGVFVLYFLVRRDWRAAAYSAVGFVSLTVAGFALSWRNSVDYWTQHVYDVTRVTDLVGLWWSPNQSITGAVERLHWLAVPTAVIPVLVALVLAMTVVAMRRALVVPHYGPALALLANAVFGMLAVPVTWSYHWVWVAPALMVLGALAVTYRSLLVAAFGALVAAVFYVAPPWALQNYDGAELSWGATTYVAGSAYVLIGLASIAVLALLREPPGVPGAPARPDAEPVTASD